MQNPWRALFGGGAGGGGWGRGGAGQAELVQHQAVADQHTVASSQQPCSGIMATTVITEQQPLHHAELQTMSKQARENVYHEGMTPVCGVLPQSKSAVIIPNGHWNNPVT